MRRLSLLAAFCLLPCAAVAQGIPPEELPPGSGFAWEPVGDRGTSARDLQFTPDGALWSAGAHLFRLDPATQTWDELDDRAYHSILVLPAGATGADTLFVNRGQGMFRSFDRGQTFTEVLTDGDIREALVEGPQGSLLTTGGQPPFLYRSADRGATWAPAAFDPPDQGRITNALLTLPPTPEHPLGVALAGASGVAVSDDGGLTFTPSALWGGGPVIHELAAVAQPDGGGRRVVTGGYRSAQPYGRAWYSDDDGATWAGEATFADVADGGVGYQSVQALVGVGGSSAYLILGRGAIYRTDDGGQTWALAGRSPMVDPANEYIGSAVVGPDGRLYVGTMRLGASTPVAGWVYRTAEPVVAANEVAPEAGDGLSLSAVPNPSSGDTSLVLTLGAASASVRVVVYDALGREVAVVHDGALGAGTHRLALDAASLPAGAYVARAVTEEGAVTARLVLTR